MVGDEDFKISTTKILGKKTVFQSLQNQGLETKT